LARYLAAIVAFTANVQTGVPEVHIAYDSTPGEARRDFMEVFLPDEQGAPSSGRRIEPAEFTVVFEALDSTSEASRLSRALNQYQIALRYWYFGGEYLALAHLYMAVEAMARSLVRAECESRGITDRDLARTHHIDPDDPKRTRWKDALETWAKKELLFEGDVETYKAAKDASDGLEHGYMEMRDVFDRALNTAEQTFSYVRRSILDLLKLSPKQFPELHERRPKDVQSSRKIVRGQFIGIGDELAPDGDTYPYLEWTSKVGAFTRTGDEFNLNHEERWTVRCHPNYAFEGVRFEARGRVEDGEHPLHITDGVAIAGPPAASPPPAALSRLMSRAALLATPVANELGQRGMSRIEALLMLHLSMQLATFEAVHVLVVDRRPASATVLLKGLLRNACLLQLGTDPNGGSGVLIRSRLDSLGRMAEAFGVLDSGERVDAERAALTEFTAEMGIVVPDELPDLTVAPIFQAHRQDALLIDEAWLADTAMIELHMNHDESEQTDNFFTQGANLDLTGGVVELAVEALLASAASVAAFCACAYDADGEAVLLGAVANLVLPSP
jgi:hypothetical protein